MSDPAVYVRNAHESRAKNKRLKVIGVGDLSIGRRAGAQSRQERHRQRRRYLEVFA